MVKIVAYNEIMAEAEDPLLGEQKNIELPETSYKSETAFNNGLYLIGLDANKVQAYGEILNAVFEKCGSTRNGLTMLQGAIYALGSREMNNPEWKEHCSSSLREIIHHWKASTIAEDFKKTFPNSPKSSETTVYRDTRAYYEYFSGIGHHNAIGIMGSMRSIKNDQTLKLEDCYSDEVFLESVKEFFDLLNSLLEFSKLTSS